MKGIANAIRIAVIACSGLVAISAGAGGIQQAFLVQNSGWMEPFYTDPASQFKQLVVAVAGAATASDDMVFTLAFNQSKASNVSPALIASSKGIADMGRHLDELKVATKGAGAALADTDFKEAISKTITGPFKAAPGIIWIFTNNRNSPDNDAQTAERNRDFYRLLHLETAITKTLVFPLKMPVQGKQFAAKGLMVYALAYGKPAAEALDRIMVEGRLTRVLTHAPARLKPVDQNAVRIVPLAVKNAPNVKASLGLDQRTLVIDVQASDLAPTVTLQAKLENLFYPYVIKLAEVDAALLSGTDRIPVRIEPSSIQGLQPGANQPIEVSFALPMAQVPSVWSAEALSAMGKQLLLPLTVEMKLTGQQLALSEGFATELRDLFPGDPISEVFTPPNSVKGSAVRVPLLVRIQYPLTPVLALVGGLLLMVGGLAAFGVVSSSSRRYEVVVDGKKRNVMLKPFTSLAITDGEGSPVGKIKRGLGRPHVVSLAAGHSVSVPRR